MKDARCATSAAFAVLVVTACAGRAPTNVGDDAARVVMSGTEDLDTIVESTLRATYTSDLGNDVSASVAIRVEGAADP